MSTEHKTICTAGGTLFNFADPEKSVFSIRDIAHALSHICRFTGHTKDFYSVAQHSVMVSEIVPKEFALQGLLHDATEAFVGDMSTPLKNMMPEYKAFEKRLEAMVLARFGIIGPLDPSVKRADLTMLATEKRDLMRTPDAEWQMLRGVAPLEKKIRAWSPALSRHMFLTRYQVLTGESLRYNRMSGHRQIN